MASLCRVILPLCPIKASLLLTPPEEFNTDASLIRVETDDGPLHIIRESAQFARTLVASGAPEDLALAERVLRAVLSAQERHPDDPHLGNFWWYLEDEVVEDLNAVEFVLSTLIPLMIEHGARLPGTLAQEIRSAIELGLEEIRRLDVSPAYTNIAAKDIVNSCLGGELLDRTDLAERGYQKMQRWLAFTDRSGTTFEFNSPTYARVTLNALGELIRHVRDDATRSRARLMAQRLGLSAALHIHPRTGRWAGPHSRAYHPTVVGASSPEREDIDRWIAETTLPQWIADVIDARPDHYAVIETAHKPSGYGLTTWHGHSFSLGTATREFGDQSNVMLAQFQRKNADRPGVFYTRYLLNDKWLGDFYHATDRSNSRNLSEEGSFLGMQSGSKAIGVYSPRNQGRISSAKAALIWTDHAQVETILVNGAPVSLPASLKPGDIVVVQSGEILQAVRPFTVSDIGRGAPMRLRELGEDLVLELYNYRGATKSFWEAGTTGGFYQGRPQLGFYTEIADGVAFDSPESFSASVASGKFLDECEAGSTSKRQRQWKLGYQRGETDLELTVDLMGWQILSRRDSSREIGWPLLDSAIARSSRNGEVIVRYAAARPLPGFMQTRRSDDTSRVITERKLSPCTLKCPAAVSGLRELPWVLFHGIAGL